jgi:hypothetical protein
MPIPKDILVEFNVILKDGVCLLARKPITGSGCGIFSTSGLDIRFLIPGTIK